MIQLNNRVITEKDLDYYKDYVYIDKTNNWFRETIALSLLDNNGYEGCVISDIYQQLHYGDLYINNISSFCNYYIDIKHSYNNSLYVDISYWQDKGKQKEYIQKNTNNNLGWLYNLDICDCLLLIDTNSRQFFIVSNWQIARQRLITLANCSNSKFIQPSCIQRLTTYDKLCGKYTDSFILHLNSSLSDYLRCNY